MRRLDKSVLVALVGAAVIGLCVSGALLAAPGESPTTNESGGGVSRSLLDFVVAGGIVGYVIIALSAAGVALVIDAAVQLKLDKLFPPSVVQESDRLARNGKFSALLSLCQASDSMVARVLRSGLDQGAHGVEAVREAMRERGTREITRLQQRVGYVGFIASVAPMLGLLGTVVGMIDSFNVLGLAKGAARPDELAVGISKALVTTCMGLIVAVPLMFFHNYFRDRVTRVSQDLAGLCERMLRTITGVVEARAAAQAEHTYAAPSPYYGAPAGRPGGVERAIESAFDAGDGDA